MKKILWSLALTVLLAPAVLRAEDLIHLYPTPDIEDEDYFGGTETYDFYYQLREVSGQRRSGHSLAKAQWFATTYENFLWHRANDDTSTHAIYRRTLGGETPEVPMRTLADLLHTFDYVYVEEPTPYTAWLKYKSISSTYYDEYVNPVESVYLVLPEGKGDFSVQFANHYARHFPYWYDQYDSEVNPTLQTVYTITKGTEASGDIVRDTADTVVCTVSNDVIYDPTGTALYTLSTSDDVTTVLSGTSPFRTVSDNVVRDASGTALYLLSDDGLTVYEYPYRAIKADVSMSLEDYSVSPSSGTTQTVQPGEFMTQTLRLTAQDAGNYGSTLGYLTFRQSAALSSDSVGWRESSPLPVVVANVYDGEAAGNPLYFDLLLLESDDIANRVKFRWGVEEDTTQSLGNFYVMRPYNNDGSMPVYSLETRVTNRTGTRYRLYRYDAEALGSASYRNIRPAYWKYDIPSDRYGTLPASFILDSHSQIAPGLVTVYNNNGGYSTLDTDYGTSVSLRLYPFATAASSIAPHDLTLSYSRVAGMTAGSWQTALSGRSNLRPFIMEFADKREDADNTAQELATRIGLEAVMVTTLPSVTLSTPYINKNALSAIQVTATVPDGLVDTDTQAALLPVQIRFRIPRQEQLLAADGRWEGLDAEAEGTDAAENARATLRKFSQFGTIWVRSPATRELDANLISAMNTRAGEHGYDVTDCVRVFTYNDELYLDFLVLLADAKSPQSNKTAFVDLIRDDGIPYLLIGDGAADGKWDLTFFVEAAAANPEATDSETESESIRADSSSGGGGGCGVGLSLWGLAIGAAILLRRDRG